jgi:hypothetical protein
VVVTLRLAFPNGPCLVCAAGSRGGVGNVGVPAAKTAFGRLLLGAFSMQVGQATTQSRGQIAAPYAIGRLCPPLRCLPLLVRLRAWDDARRPNGIYACLGSFCQNRQVNKL